MECRTKSEFVWVLSGDPMPAEPGAVSSSEAHPHDQQHPGRSESRRGETNELLEKLRPRISVHDEPLDVPNGIRKGPI